MIINMFQRSLTHMPYSVSRLIAQFQLTVSSPLHKSTATNYKQARQSMADNAGADNSGAATALTICGLAGSVLMMLSLSAPLAAQEQVGMFKSSYRPGGIALVDIGPATAALPEAIWNERPLAVLEHQARAIAVVGVPLSTNAGEQKIQVKPANGPHSEASFKVNAHAYKEQRLTIINKRKVTPAPLDMQRITKENKRLKEVKSMRAQTLLARDFIWPVLGPVTSPFGLKRFFNDKPRRPHGGIDVAANIGTPILAAADGLIIEAGDYFFNGNSVFIEHGLGLQTFYAHMSRIDVAAGERVSQGQVIGAVGATGRVTGPHLHWSVALNGTWIDPLLVLDSDQPEQPIRQ